MMCAVKNLTWLGEQLFERDAPQAVRIEALPSHIQVDDVDLVIVGYMVKRSLGNFVPGTFVVTAIPFPLQADEEIVFILGHDSPDDVGALVIDCVGDVQGSRTVVHSLSFGRSRLLLLGF